MCRLFGMFSVGALNASRYLLEDPCSLYDRSKVDQTKTIWNDRREVSEFEFSRETHENVPGKKIDRVPI